jgi:hypothetical protein
MTRTTRRPQRRPAGPALAGSALGGPALVVAGLACLAAVTGCSVTPPSAASPAAAVTVTSTAAPPAAATASTSPVPSAPATSPAAAATAPASPVASATVTAPAAPATVPVLGRPAGVFAAGTGFGAVRPSRIFNGGDPSGLVTGVSWQSWGGARATATGTADYVGPGQSVATGAEETATVVAFHLGTCHGKLMYRALEWYFPQHGQKFSPAHYENICTGSYVPGS